MKKLLFIAFAMITICSVAQEDVTVNVIDFTTNKPVVGVEIIWGIGTGCWCW